MLAFIGTINTISAWRGFTMAAFNFPCGNIGTKEGISSRKAENMNIFQLFTGPGTSFME